MPLNINLISLLEKNEYANFFDVLDFLSDAEKEVLAEKFEIKLNHLSYKLENSIMFPWRKRLLIRKIIYYFAMYASLGDTVKPKKTIGFGELEQAEN